MKLVLGFLLGLIVATVGQLLAQSGGTVLDQYGNAYPYFNSPGGVTTYRDRDGNFNTIYQMPGSFGMQPKSPC